MIKKNQSRWLNYLLPLLLLVMILGMLQVTAATTRVECENMTVGGSYAAKITSPFSGAALRANNDYCAYTQYFGLATHDFAVRGCSNNSGAAQVVLKIGGTAIGTLSFSGTTPTVKTLTNITHGTGNQEVRLTVTSDNGSWDAYVDYFEIISGSGSTPTPTQSSTPTPTRQGSTPTPTQRVNNTPTPTQGGTTTPTPTTGTITIPPYSSLPAIAKFPDPFKFMDESRMTSKAQWAARRAEISALSQAFEFGTKPPIPSNVTGSFSGNSLTVNVTENGKSISFNCSITYPSTGTRPYPAMIGIGGSNLNNSTLSSLGVAIINFPTEDVANNINRGQGKFYTLYGTGHSAGSIIAWAWGVDCMITALEKTTAANLDPKRLGVTGCSRYGKGALIAGAFCDRIALTIPQESGSGGAGNWRVADYVKSTGVTVETLAQIVNGDSWFTPAFSQFSSTATKLPYDHHQIIGLVAPRALLIIENTGIDYLCPVGCWDNANAAHWIWQALGVPDKMGYSGNNHGASHCSFPSSQQPEVTAYVQKFLVGGGTGNTNVMKNDTNLNFDQAKWIDWTVPTLQ